MGPLAVRYFPASLRRTTRVRSVTRPNETCRTCGFELRRPFAELPSSWLAIYSDARFPGRCILLLKQHYEHFDAVPGRIAEQFTRDMQAAGGAIMRATGALRMNYALLGNSEPHLHCHLIPRQIGDPVVREPPWLHPERESPLTEARHVELEQAIRVALGATNRG